MTPLITLRSAEAADLDALVRLEHQVEAALPSRDIFATDEREFYEPIVQGAGHILLAFDDEARLAGASVIRFPAQDEPENLGLALSLPANELARVRHLESVFVRPDMQGRKLAERLVRENMRLTEESGRTVSMATAWPGNAASLKLHLRLGLYIRAFAFKYGGKPRFILMSGGSADLTVPPVLVRAMDIARHRSLLTLGLAGVAVHSSAGQDGPLVEYRPLKEKNGAAFAR